MTLLLNLVSIVELLVVLVMGYFLITAVVNKENEDKALRYGKLALSFWVISMMLACVLLAGVFFL